MFNIEINTTQFNYSGIMDSFNEQSRANAAFICKAVNNYDGLLDFKNEALKVIKENENLRLKEIEKLRAINDSLLNALKDVIRCFDDDANVFRSEQKRSIANAKEAIQKASQ